METNYKISDIRQYLLFVMAFMILQAAAREGAQGEAAPSPDCNRTCGGVEVPYPFGLDSDDPAGLCQLRDGTASSFALTCDRSHHPPKLFSSNIERNDRYQRAGTDYLLSPLHGNVEVTGINITSGHLRVLLPLAYDCYDSSGNSTTLSIVNVTLADPFVFSPTENMFVVVGCEGVAGFTTDVYNFGGCVSGCNSLEAALDGECSGLGCCEAPNLLGVKSYRTWVYARSGKIVVSKFNPCSYYFMVEKNNYTFKRSDLISMNQERRFPVILDWSIGNRRCDQAARNKSSYACVAVNSECHNSANSTVGYLCKCSQGYQGNPYLLDGCQDIDECQTGRAIYPCYGECTNTVGGYECRCPKGYQSNDPKREGCFKDAKLSLKLILLIGIGGGLLILAFLTALCCLEYQRRKINTLRKKHFKSNGGVFLQELLSVHQSAFKIFSYNQLMVATNNFSKTSILGRGGFGIVYKGLTEDGIEIAVKKSTKIDEKNSRDFANELFILSQVNHNNIVKLLGCCLEDDSPMLVYEFVPRGTLFYYIHGDEQHKGFNARLRIATKVAEAFKYLHFDASPPILHGDVKSANILLDDDLQPKVSDFGTSKLVLDDSTKFTTLLRGTPGYLDPEYLTTGALTDKSDVFSFGVVLLELLTRKKPLNFIADSDTERILYLHFLSCAKANKLREILDPELIKDGLSIEVEKFVEIALACIEMEGEKRPTMKEVASRLESIKASEELLERHPSPSHGIKETKPLLEGPSSTGTSTGNVPQSTVFTMDLPR